MMHPDKHLLWYPPLEYQGNAGNCVAHAIAVMHEVYEHYYRPRLGHRDFSVGYTYGLANWNVGMDEVQALKTTVAHGNVLRSDFENLSENPACYRAVQEVKGSLHPIKYFGDWVSLGKVELIRDFILRYSLPVLLVVKNASHAVACIGWERVLEREVTGYQNGLPFTESHYADNLICVDSHNKISTFTRFDAAYGLVPISTEIEYTQQEEPRMDKFSDVKKDQWFYDAVMAAVSDGVMTGYPDGTFRPDAPITRAQYCIIYKRLKDLGLIGGQK